MSEESSSVNYRVKVAGFILGPLLGIIVGYYLRKTGWSTEAQVVGLVTVLCAVWWICEPLPIPVTSLIPMAVFPMTGVMSRDNVAKSYGDWLILLLMGGFIISRAMEKSGTHLRLAQSMIKIFGGRGRNLIFGFMFASALLSMWISNTATTLMFLPIALAVISQSNDKYFSVALLLGICYASSIGGIGTPIGTPPNAIFISEYKKITNNDYSFLSWMKLMVPLVFILLPIVALIITRKLKSQVEIKLPESGKWRQGEIRTLIVFGFIALAWVLRTEPFGGWSKWFSLPNAGDADVALLGVVLLFLIPNGEVKGERLLDWESAVKIPWGILLLFGGGLTIANAFKDVGLSMAIGKQLSSLINIHPFLLILVICLAITFLSEVASNSATALLIVPILGQMALESKGINSPALLMIPATISASCGFMLPVATPPNAIVFGSGKISIQDMAREGFIIDLVAAFIIALYFYFTLS